MKALVDFSVNMPKQSKDRVDLIQQYANSYGWPFSVVDLQFRCTLCNKGLNVVRKSQGDQHIQTAMHQRKLAISSEPQPENESTPQDTFVQELFSALIVADIAPYKLRNQTFRDFLHKYTKMQIPSDTLIRRQLQTQFDLNMDRIRNYFSESSIWVSIDETQDILS